MTALLTPLPSPRGTLSSATAAKPWNILPFPNPATAPHDADFPRPSRPLPAWPDQPPEPVNVEFPPSWPPPLAPLPTAGAPRPQVPVGESAAAAAPAPAPGGLPEILWAATPAPATEPAPAATADEPAPQDFTDDDLRAALGPIVEQAVRRSVYATENGIDTYLEPMLRATIRRALAEYAPASRPFQPPGAFDRFVWHLKALFSSRTYEDILFEKTRRFQIEEVYLLDARTLALVSFASCDPARHASARRVSGTAQRLASQLPAEQGGIHPLVELSDRRWLIARQGSCVVLMALVRGKPGELVAMDLEFALRRIEDRFRERFQQEGSELLRELQPFLEDCLLIQSPASAA